MRPGVDETLRMLMATLAMELAPHLAGDYRQSSANMVAVTLLLVAEEYDRAAAVRAEENRAIRALFVDAIPAISDAGLRERVVAAARRVDDDLRVSALDASNVELRSLLVEVHAIVENRDRELDRRIWSLLREGAERRALSLPFFG